VDAGVEVVAGAVEVDVQVLLLGQGAHLRAAAA